MLKSLITNLTNVLTYRYYYFKIGVNYMSKVKKAIIQQPVLVHDSYQQQKQCRKKCSQSSINQRFNTL